MAKNRRVSGSGLVTTGNMKRLTGRNALSGRYVEVVKAHGNAWVDATTFTEVTLPKVPIHGRIQRKMLEAMAESVRDDAQALLENGTITANVRADLLAQAKARTGITSDAEVVEYALANVEVKDNFAKAFHAVRGKMDPDIDFGF